MLYRRLGENDDDENSQHAIFVPGLTASTSCCTWFAAFRSLVRRYLLTCLKHRTQHHSNYLKYFASNIEQAFSKDTLVSITHQQSAKKPYKSLYKYIKSEFCTMISRYLSPRTNLLSRKRVASLSSFTFNSESMPDEVAGLVLHGSRHQQSH